MYRYLLVIDENLIVRRELDSPKFERYDAESKQWILDWDLSEIFTGDVRTKPLKEDEAWTMLNSQS